jgi:nucleoside-diphosphate-sugar epimerase
LLQTICFYAILYTMKKTVLVTGAGGTVGSETLKELLKKNERYNIKTFDLSKPAARKALKPYKNGIQTVWGDLRDPEAVTRAVTGVDVAIHLGAVIPPLADRIPSLAESVNVGGTQNLVRALSNNKKDARIIFASSISVYGDRISDPWIRVTDTLKQSVGDYYAGTKIKGEKIIRESGLRWTIFRLTAIMYPDLKMDPLLFHMPLDTRLEILTARDTGSAMAKAVERENLTGKIFNLGGGSACRTTFKKYLENVFSIMGLGKDFLPDFAFAKHNFHCGYYSDSDDLEELLRFRRETLDDLYKQIDKRATPSKKLFTRLFKSLIKDYLLRRSEPLKARRTRNQALLSRFFPTRA